MIIVTINSISCRFKSGWQENDRIAILQLYLILQIETDMKTLISVNYWCTDVLSKNPFAPGFHLQGYLYIWISFATRGTLTLKCHSLQEIHDTMVILLLISITLQSSHPPSNTPVSTMRSLHIPHKCVTSTHAQRNTHNPAGCTKARRNETTWGNIKHLHIL